MTTLKHHPQPSRQERGETDLLTAGFQLQHQGLDLLLAEMRALAALMPGEDSRLPTDAEIEASFDNMPI